MNKNEMLQDNINTCSSPKDLKITDVRFAKITGAPMDCIMVKVFTNSSLVGFGEVRDWSSATYAKMLKSRIIGENPCNIDKIFRLIKPFGGHSRMGGGVSGIELALWDLAGKAYGVPVYQMLGGSFRDKIRVYSDTDCEGKDGMMMGKALKKRKEMGFTFLKMDLGIDQLLDEPGALSSPIGFVDELIKANNSPMYPNKGIRTKSYNESLEVINIAHPFTATHITEKGFDILENYLREARSQVGYEIPLAIDHIGHIDVTDCIKFANMIEKYNIAWLEDALPWQYTDQYVRLANSTRVPLATGEDIYLKENFEPLLNSGSLSVIHPDILTTGGILETKKIGDMAQDKGVAMAIHMAETPIACMAAAHIAKATENFLALEFHSVDIPWWDSLVNYSDGRKHAIENGFISNLESPGLGIDSLNDEVIKEHMHPDEKGIWQPTDKWDVEWSHDRLWS
ncbi:MAG: mandelate racemase/muconate lactonizing enzyme family protein [Sphaerochaetaceae bacterium]|nr:mandelate racemase/muconate lactonizing enzyme family protein [Sphaerochaetaceae bacterium]MDC7248980.1 mandelate racemase/muconate lactonizing enzyme family protein [Sphaerochaetaceae bacterium]